ncbi:MAG: glycogen synthase GlgA [Candidatus Kuenenia sp.]|nr:glycogen synthase GlgA [Candidatus Kuenenia hertensis]
MNVVYLSSEVLPFAKSGGLADISSVIPKNLNKLGVNIIVIMPFYTIVKECNCPIEKTDITYRVIIGDEVKTCCVYRSFLPGTDVPVYLLHNEQYFGRNGLYNYPGTMRNYEDNCERFVFFSKTAIELIPRLKLHPDIIHCNDWQTGLVPVYLKTLYKNNEYLKKTRMVMTIHNLAYQGLFSPDCMKYAGLDWNLFHWNYLEFYGMLNFLKAGIVFSDIITTVSETYAEEIQTPEYGEGLDGVLRTRAKDIYGILNGIDYSLWNPENDAFIAANYTEENLTGKQVCKKALQRKLELPEKDVSVIAMITRLTDQKGLDLVMKIFKNLLKFDIQFVLLGTGEIVYQDFFKHYAKIVPEKVSSNISFNEPLAHQIEAGADIFLMPSRYEPCGLNQLYSLKYGTVPIVRHTGGLADTIFDIRHEKIHKEKANGFSFKEYNADLLYATIIRAFDFYKNRSEWTKLMRNGMKQNWPWEKSAKKYISLYESITKN